MDWSGLGRQEAIALLADGLSHKLRNTLNAMRAHIAVAQKQVCASPDSVPQQLDKLERAILEAESGLQEFLDLANPQHETVQEADLAVLMREVLTYLALDLEQGRIQVEERLPADLPRVHVPLGAMKQAVLKLLVNAREAMPAGGTLTVAASSDYATGRPTGRLDGPPSVVLEVGDTGVGIEEPDRGRVFEPFFSKKPGRHGLSLAIVKQTVEALGGSIEFNSEPGHGSIFRLTLPTAAPRPLAPERHEHRHAALQLVPK